MAWETLNYKKCFFIIKLSYHLIIKLFPPNKKH